ncbi:MAG: transcription elongation factor [Bryobacteraceae bacterium]|nr:transcription elongation factor [Bryobacteraceae bacterium]
MPSKTTVKRARKAAQEGKAPSTQAGEFVREEIGHVRQGKHGARNAKQAIAIGLSKARRAGVALKPPKKGTTSEKTRKSAARDYEKGQSGTKRTPSATRSQAAKKALKREGRSAASKPALSRQAKTGAQKRTAKRSARAPRLFT